MGSRYYYLGLDQGTTGTTALLLDESWNQIARGHVDIRQYYPKAGWVEHDPIEIYDSLLEAAVQALRSAGASAREVRCIGLDNQGETIVFWDKQSGDPVYPPLCGRTAGLRRRWTGLTDSMVPFSRNQRG